MQGLCIERLQFPCLLSATAAFKIIKMNGQSNLSKSSLPTFTCAGSKRHTLHGKPSQLTW